MIEFYKNEHVLLEMRRHWLVFSFQLFGVAIGAIAPFFIYAIIVALPIQIVLPGNFGSLAFFILMVWYLVLWIIGFVIWTDHYLDVWIVTNERFIDVEQKGMFSRHIATLHLDKIQDVTSRVDGFMATHFKYGDIHVQSAGSEREFIIRDVTDPDGFRLKINAAIREYMENYMETDERNVLKPHQHIYQSPEESLAQRQAMVGKKTGSHTHHVHHAHPTDQSHPPNLPT